MLTFIVAVVCLAAGFGAGRVKNAKKLAAVRAELNQAELDVTGEGKAVISRVRAVVGAESKSIFAKVRSWL